MENELEKQIAVSERHQVAQASNDRAGALRFAELVVEEVMSHPTGIVDMMRLRLRVAEKAGIKNPELVGSTYPLIEHSLEESKSEISHAASREEGIARESEVMAEKIASGQLSASID